VAFGFAIFITSWFFCIINKNALFRKVSLLFNVVAILTYLNNPDTPIDTILRALPGLFLGVGCALVASFFPWPVMANR